MASPQLEEGSLQIAWSLAAAIYRARLSGLEHDVLGAIMLLTYARNMIKAEISVEDIRYQLGADPNLRSDRIEASLNRLLEMNILYKQSINQHRFILGVQKDFEKWGSPIKTDKMSPLSVSNINNINTHRDDKMSEMKPKPAVQQLLAYVETKGVKLTGKGFMLESRAGRKLLADATALIRSPGEALEAVKDYLDELYKGEWAKSHLRYPLTYAAPRFEQWYKNIPAKPRWVRENEEITQKRFVYDSRKRDWYEGRRYE